MTQHPRDEALHRVGKALYEEYWIGSVSKATWTLARSSADHLPKDAKAATRAAKAGHLNNAAAEQMGRVISWLEANGIDCIKTSFDSGRFEKFFRKNFGSALPTGTVRRKNMVKILSKKHRPGRGGDMRWDVFCDLVRKKTGEYCDDKTIKRDYKTIGSSK